MGECASFSGGRMPKHVTVRMEDPHKHTSGEVLVQGWGGQCPQNPFGGPWQACSATSLFKPKINTSQRTGGSAVQF